MTFFLGDHFEKKNFKKKSFVLLYLTKKTKGFHVSHHFFLYYGWFLQNLRKNFIRTNMHTTVKANKVEILQSAFNRRINRYKY